MRSSPTRAASLRCVRIPAQLPRGLIACLKRPEEHNAGAYPAGSCVLVLKSRKKRQRRGTDSGPRNLKFSTKSDVKRVHLTALELGFGEFRTKMGVAYTVAHSLGACFLSSEPGEPLDTGLGVRRVVRRCAGHVHCRCAGGRWQPMPLAWGVRRGLAGGSPPHAAERPRGQPEVQLCGWVGKRMGLSQPSAFAGILRYVAVVEGSGLPAHGN